jgi:23S rRNA (uracil1939-C5)-methyltransferase
MPDPVIKLAAKGDGITAAGKFVAGAVPGDVIADDGSITAGPHRQVPPCRHFAACGGCQLQHVDDTTLATHAHDRVRDALKGVGLEPEIRPTHLSPAHSRRRASLRAQRKGKRVTLGYAQTASHVLIDVQECPVMHPKLFALLAPLRQLLSTLIPERRTADIRMTLADQGVDLMLAGVTADGLAAAEMFNDFAVRHRLARLSLDEGYGATARYEPEPVTVTLGGAAVPLPEGAFLQATADGEAILVDAVREIVGDAPVVADLFAGLGTFALSLSGKVMAIEGARDAALSLKAGANKAQRHIAVDHRDLFRRPLTGEELKPFSAVVIDPPRAGAKEQAPALADSAVPRIAFVSCNPSTFARDAQTLAEGGYTLHWVQPVAQFRWATHIELVGYFSKNGATPRG